MDDDKILQNGGSEKDIEEYAKQNGADLTKEDFKNVSSNSLVKATYRFPNGNIATFGYDEQQIPELQGVYSEELIDKIKLRSDNRTLWNGF